MNKGEIPHTHPADQFTQFVKMELAQINAVLFLTPQPLEPHPSTNPAFSLSSNLIALSSSITQNRKIPRNSLKAEFLQVKSPLSIPYRRKSL
jgi:hypothetical protein